MAFKERAPSPPREKAAKDTKTSKAAKGGKDKGGKDKDGKSSRPPSQQFDISKPFWVLRFVSDASAVVSNVQHNSTSAFIVRACVTEKSVPLVCGENLPTIMWKHS